MSETGSERVHKDILLPDEVVQSEHQPISTDGQFEPDFDFYAYALLVKNAASERKGRGEQKIEDNLKLAVSIALLLENQNVNEYQVEKALGVGNRTLNAMYARTFDERDGTRAEFVDRYTHPDVLKSVKATPAIIDLFERIASRLAMNAKDT